MRPVSGSPSERPPGSAGCRGHSRTAATSVAALLRQLFRGTGPSSCLPPPPLLTGGAAPDACRFRRAGPPPTLCCVGPPFIAPARRRPADHPSIASPRTFHGPGRCCRGIATLLRGGVSGAVAPGTALPGVGRSMPRCCPAFSPGSSRPAASRPAVLPSCRLAVLPSCRLAVLPHPVPPLVPPPVLPPAAVFGLLSAVLPPRSAGREPRKIVLNVPGVFQNRHS